MNRFYMLSKQKYSQKMTCMNDTFLREYCEKWEPCCMHVLHFSFTLPNMRTFRKRAAYDHVVHMCIRGIVHTSYLYF